MLASAHISLNGRQGEPRRRRRSSGTADTGRARHASSVTPPARRRRANACHYYLRTCALTRLRALAHRLRARARAHAAHAAHAKRRPVMAPPGSRLHVDHELTSCSWRSWFSSPRRWRTSRSGSAPRGRGRLAVGPLARARQWTSRSWPPTGRIGTMLSSRWAWDTRDALAAGLPCGGHGIPAASATLCSSDAQRHDDRGQLCPARGQLCLKRRQLCSICVRSVV